MSYVDPPKGRKMTPKGQMSSSGSGPAIMMMPPYIRATFMPDPPLKPIPPPRRCRPKLYKILHSLLEENSLRKDKRVIASTVNRTGVTTELCSMKIKNYKDAITGISSYMCQFEQKPSPEHSSVKTPETFYLARAKRRAAHQKEKTAPEINEYKNSQRTSGGEYSGMNCYNTLFVGRLAYEVTERRLLRELEHFGPVKDLKLIVERSVRNENESDIQKYKTKSKGYAFVEYEHEEDMKRAYRDADGMKIEGREIVVDVERGHTVPNWLPRRFGGGLGGTRIGGKFENVNMPGRFDPSKPRSIQTRTIAPSSGYIGGPFAYQQSGGPNRGVGYFGDSPKVPPSGYGGGDYRRHDRPPPLSHGVYGIDRQGYGGGRFLNRSPAGCYGNVVRHGLPPHNKINREHDHSTRRKRSSSRSPDRKEDRRRRY